MRMDNEKKTKRVYCIMSDVESRIRHGTLRVKRLYKMRNYMEEGDITWGQEGSLLSGY